MKLNECWWWTWSTSSVSRLFYHSLFWNKTKIKMFSIILIDLIVSDLVLRHKNLIILVFNFHWTFHIKSNSLIFSHFIPITCKGKNLCFSFITCFHRSVNNLAVWCFALVHWIMLFSSETFTILKLMANI